MAKETYFSKKLPLQLDASAYEAAVRCHSQECVIVKAMRKANPRLTNIFVSTATIRASDREAGVRLTWIPNAEAVQTITAFDQGWPLPFREITLSRPAVITPIIRSAIAQEQSRITGEARLQELEAMRAEGKALTPVEKRAMTRIKNNARRQRPDTPGRPQVKVDSRGAQVVGPAPLAGPEKANPKLLPSTLRVGAGKMADLGLAFMEAVAGVGPEEREKMEADVRRRIEAEIRMKLDAEMRDQILTDGTVLG